MVFNAGTEVFNGSIVEVNYINSWIRVELWLQENSWQPGLIFWCLLDHAALFTDIKVAFYTLCTVTISVRFNQCDLIANKYSTLQYIVKCYYNCQRKLFISSLYTTTYPIVPEHGERLRLGRNHNDYDSLLSEVQTNLDGVCSMCSGTMS